MTARTRERELHIDWTACDGRGLCAELLPHLLSRDEWGYPVARRASGLTLEAGELAAAQEAAGTCPLQALSLRERRDA